MEPEYSETGWTYLPATPHRGARRFSWTITLYRGGPSRALIWPDGSAEPVVVEVDGPCALMAAVLGRLPAMQPSERGD